MINHLKTIDSTQTFLKENIHLYSEFDGVLADVQTSGYGRSGMWDSHNKNLHFSVALLTHNNIFAKCLVAFHMTSLQLNRHAKLVFPNDIYLEGKKVGGLLLEPCDGKYVCGFGLNLSTSTSNYNHITNANISPIEVAEHLTLVLKSVINWNEQQLIAYYKSNMNIFKSEIQYFDKKTEATKFGIVTDLSLDKIYIDGVAYHHMQVKLIDKK